MSREYVYIQEHDIEIKKINASHLIYALVILLSFPFLMGDSNPLIYAFLNL